MDLNPDVMDVISWSWELDGRYSCQSAYRARFWGREVSPTAVFTWSSRAPLCCRFFTWLAVQSRCWTPDWLARHGLDHHDVSPFCAQEETIGHILLNCVMARKVWTIVCTALNKPGWVPTIETNLVDWCAEKNGTSKSMKEMQTIILLVVWELWKHQNAIVFNGATVSLQQILHRIASEGRVWRQAGLLRGELDAFFVEELEWARRE